MDGKKRRRSGNENSRMSQKKLNKLKRHKPKPDKYISAEFVDSETDESQSDDDDVMVALVNEPPPLAASPVHSMPSPSNPESRSASPNGSSVASNAANSDNEGVNDDQPPTPGVVAVLPPEMANEMDHLNQHHIPIDFPGKSMSV